MVSRLRKRSFTAGDAEALLDDLNRAAQAISRGYVRGRLSSGGAG